MCLIYVMFGNGFGFIWPTIFGCSILSTVYDDYDTSHSSMLLFSFFLYKFKLHTRVDLKL